MKLLKHLLLLEAVFGSEIDKNVKSYLDTLSERERIIIKSRYGIHPKTFEEVARKFRVTRERIRQLEQKALRKLRHRNRIKILVGFKDWKLYFSNGHKKKKDNLLQQTISKGTFFHQGYRDYIDMDMFDKRTSECLRSVGIITWSHLLSMSAEDLLSIEKFGRKCLENVKSRISDLRINT